MPTGNTSFTVHLTPSLLGLAYILLVTTGLPKHAVIFRTLFLCIPNYGLCCSLTAVHQVSPDGTSGEDADRCMSRDQEVRCTQLTGNGFSGHGGFAKINCNTRYI